MFSNCIRNEVTSQHFSLSVRLKKQTYTTWQQTATYPLVDVVILLSFCVPQQKGDEEGVDLTGDGHLIRAYIRQLLLRVILQFNRYKLR